MRITAGRFKGRSLHAPQDRSTRPTSDKVRQAVFNILTHGEIAAGFALEGAAVIDVFAGTGAMGLEAISRGAAYCLFVEDAAAARAIIRQNVEALGLSGATKIWRRDGTSLGPLSATARGPFTLAVLDPPYRHGLLVPALRALCEGGWLKPDAMVICEAAVDDTVDVPPGYELLDQRTYGESKILVLRFGPVKS
jgi:16S rRNA (guanine966-N2)-methyltransferase